MTNMLESTELLNDIQFLEAQLNCDLGSYSQKELERAKEKIAKLMQKAVIIKSELPRPDPHEPWMTSRDTIKILTASDERKQREDQSKRRGKIEVQFQRKSGSFFWNQGFS